VFYNPIRRRATVRRQGRSQTWYAAFFIKKGNMNVIRHHRRIIALISAFAFFWLIQADCLPLRAEPTDSQPSAFSSSEQGP
jgi:hypothetical protein